MAHHFTNIQNSYPPFKKGGKTAFFCHSSFEPRTLACIPSSERCPNIVATFIFHSRDCLGSDKYKKNHAKIVDHFSEISLNDPIEVPVVFQHEDDLIATHGDSIVHALNEADDIVVDLSTFTRGVMVRIVDFILRSKGNKPLYIFYSEPDKYATEKNGNRIAWLAKGTRNIISVPGFSGEKQEDKKTLLVVLLGHNAEQSISTIGTVNPDMIVVVSQRTLMCRKKLQGVFLKNSATVVKQYADKIASILTVPLRGWEEMYDVLIRIKGLYSNQYNIIVSLDGTKIQAFGALAFCQRHQSVELLYAEPEEYNCDSYSEGVGVSWWVEVPDIGRFKKR